MILSPTTVHLAFVVHLEGPNAAAADIARIEHMAHLFRGHHVPTTWSVADCCDLGVLQHKGVLQAGDELAIAISPAEAQSRQFRQSMRERINSLQACSRSPVGLVSSQPALIRPSTAYMAELGVHGVLSNMSVRSGESIYSPLPSGLWQLDNSMQIPQQSWLSSLLSGNAIRRLQKTIARGRTMLVSVDAVKLAHGSARGLQSLEKLLRYASHAASRDEIAITTAGAIVERLAASRTARPQHSILRAA